MLTIVRALAGLILGLVIFAGLLYFLVVVNFSQRLAEPEVYNVALRDTNAYNRIYDEVLVDEDIRNQTRRLLGNTRLDLDEEAVEVLRQVMPPTYLRQQTEDNIDNFTGFLRYEREELEIYATLTEPLERIEPAVILKIHQRIDNLEINDPPASDCSTAALLQLAAASARPYAQLSGGEIPDSAPSLQILTAECRAREFDRWFDLVLNDPAMNAQAALILEGERVNLRAQFIAGDTRAFLKAVADPLVKPLIEDAIADIRRNLQRNDRFDLLEWLAKESEYGTRAEIDEQTEYLRGIVSAANGPGRYIALAMAVLGCLLLAAVHFPRPPEMLRWPGVTLMLGSGVCLIMGVVLNSAIPGQFKDAVVRVAYYSPSVPSTAINLAGDIVESFARQATSGFIPPSIAVMLIGAFLVAASLVSGLLLSTARRVIPNPIGRRSKH